MFILYEFFSAKEMIDCPFETRSDSFYFVDDVLIMHNKADYAYNGGMQWTKIGTTLLRGANEIIILIIKQGMEVESNYSEHTIK